MRQAAADVIFLAEADDAHGLLAAQIAQPSHRLPGRRIGLFIRSTNYVHELPASHVGRVGRAVAEAYTYRPLSPAQPRIFHEIVSRRFPLLDAALCLDEVFVARQGRRHIWLPDISATSQEGEAVGGEAAAWHAQVLAFLESQSGKPVVVYTGTADPRRGYRELRQFAADIGGCFIHCGRPWTPDGTDGSAEDGAKARLATRSAILESGRPYESFETASVTLRAARCVVLPYPRHLGSSGAMLQALAAGRPVLVPDQGLMAWRVRTFGLGLTYAPGDWRDLRYKFSLLQTTPSEDLADRIGRFLAYFGRVQLEAAMDCALGLARTLPRAPTADRSDPASRTK
jgi:glycosyltransferase involved in cell wall biosynthesis